MGRTCTICTCEHRTEIEEAIVAGTPYRDIARRWGVSRDAVMRHKRDHLSPAIVAVAAEREAAGTRSLVDRVEDLITRTERILTAAERSGGVTTALAAVRELRELLRLMGAASGELNDRPQVTLNLMQAPEWLAVRAAVFAALQSHPAARAEVASRLLELESGE